MCLCVRDCVQDIYYTEIFLKLVGNLMSIQRIPQLTYPNTGVAIALIPLKCFIQAHQFLQLFDIRNCH